MSANSNNVETVTELPDIAAEQAALAAGAAAATQQTEQVVATQVEEPKSEELTPAAKQAIEAEKAENELTSFDDFLKQKNTGDKPPATEATTTAKVDKVAPASKSVEAATKTVERDFTGIAPEHQHLFKQMSNDAFNTLKAEYIENRTLKQQLADVKKGGIPESYLEHEQAYVLTPEFAQQSERVTDAETIHQHYTSQLQALRGGAEEYTILQRNAQGQLVVSAPIKADRGTIDQMADVRQSAYQQLLTAQAQLNAVGATHRQRATEYRQQLSDFDAKAFPVFKDKPELKAMVDDTIQKVLPKPYQNNPLAALFAKAVIIMTEQGKLLAQKQTTTQAAVPAKTASPSAAEIASGGASSTSGAKEEVTMDMFQKAKKGLL